MFSIECFEEFSDHRTAPFVGHDGPHDGTHDGPLSHGHPGHRIGAAAGLPVSRDLPAAPDREVPRGPPDPDAVRGTRTASRPRGRLPAPRRAGRRRDRARARGATRPRRPPVRGDRPHPRHLGHRPVPRPGRRSGERGRNPGSHSHAHPHPHPHPPALLPHHLPPDGRGATGMGTDHFAPTPGEPGTVRGHRRPTTIPPVLAAQHRCGRQLGPVDPRPPRTGRALPRIRRRTRHPPPTRHVRRPVLGEPQPRGLRPAPAGQHRAPGGRLGEHRRVHLVRAPALRRCHRDRRSPHVGKRLGRGPDPAPGSRTHPPRPGRPGPGRRTPGDRRTRKGTYLPAA